MDSGLEKRIERLENNIDLVIEKMGLENRIIEDKPNAGQDVMKQEDAKPGDRLEALKIKMYSYMEESTDILFTQYLRKVEKEIEVNQKRIKNLENDLERAYSVYKGNYIKTDDSFPPSQRQQPEAIIDAQPCCEEDPPDTQAAGAPVNHDLPHSAVGDYMPIFDVSPNCEPRRRIETTPAFKKPQQKNTMEFKIGAGLLSIIGVMFVLVSFVTFGLNFLSGLAQGICLFIISAAVLAVSELVIKRKNERISLVITGLGICSLYISTIINYLYLGNLQGLSAIILTVIIAGSAFYISRERESGTIRIISFIGCYICFFPVRGFVTGLDFIIITTILFVVNIICIFYPLKNQNNIIHYVHMASNTLFTCLLILAAWVSGLSDLYILFFLMTAVIISNTIFYKQYRTELSTVLYIIQLSFYGMLIIMFIAGSGYGILTAILCFSIGAFYFIFENGRRERWIQYYYFIIMFFCCFLFTSDNRGVLLAALVVFIAVKLTANERDTDVLNCIVTVLAVIVGVALHKEPLAWLMAGAMAISLIRIKRNHYLHEISVTVFLILFLILKFDNEIYLPASIAVVCMLLFMIPRLPNLSGMKNNGYFYFVFSLTALAYLEMPFIHHPVSFAILLGLGVLICVAFVNSRYGIPVKKYHLITAIFLTYMTFTCKFGIPIIISIILMLIALSSVGVGFYRKERAVRLYGLFLSLFVCAKLICYDFLEAKSMQRILLFLIVGIIALSISFIYIHLEKTLKQNTDLEKM